MIGGFGLLLGSLVLGCAESGDKAATDSSNVAETAENPPKSTPPAMNESSGSNIVGGYESIVAEENDLMVKVNLSADVLFDFDKATLRPEAASQLEEVAEIIRNKAQGPVTITGHTDAKGTDAYNDKLSVRRAETVKDWFVSHGLTAIDFKTSGRGSKVPVAENTKADGSDNPEGRAQNRRVEIVVNKTGKASPGP